MVVRAPGPSPDDDLQLRMASTARRTVSAAVERGGGIFVEGEGAPSALTFDIGDETPGEGCPEEAVLIDRPLTGLGVRTGDAP